MDAMKMRIDDMVEGDVIGSCGQPTYRVVRVNDKTVTVELYDSVRGVFYTPADKYRKLDRMFLARVLEAGAVEVLR